MSINPIIWPPFKRSGTTITPRTSGDEMTINSLTATNTLKLGTSPTTGAFEEGKIYYDSTNKTVSAMIDTDVTLQIGQEDLMICKNASGVDIANGDAVYMASADSGFPTIALAQADSFSTSIVTAVATQAIANGATGLVTRRGRVNDLDTNVAEGWSAGDILYLSTTVAGGLTNVNPGSVGEIESRVARVVTVDDTVGVIYVDLFRTTRLTDLSDANIATTPSVDDVLKYNGSEWVNGTGTTVSSSSGITFYPTHTEILPEDSENDYDVQSLLQTPSGDSEEVDTMSCATNTVMGDAFLYNTALGRTSINAGEWIFNIYASVSSVRGGRESYITGNIYHVVTESATITTTGSGTTRTATASGGTPFANDDDNADITLCGYIQTPKGLYPIAAYTSGTVVTITVPSGYGNESTQAFFTWKRKFGAVTPTITATGTDYTLINLSTVQSAITIAATDKIAGIIFGTANNTTDIYFAHDGTEHYSNFLAPLTTLHNDLAGLNGGTAGEYYHLTSAAYTIATQAATTSLSGYLTDTDWDTFNNKGSGDMLLGTAQSVTETKTFSKGKLLVKGTSTGTTDITTANASGTSYTATLQAADGTIAYSADITGTNSGTNTGDEVVATGAELDTASDETKYASAKAIKDSHNVPSVLPSTAGNVLTSNGTDWTSAAGTAGTVTSVAALTLGTTGTDVSSTVATGTSTPVITLQIPTASTSNRGALSSTDWDTFNGKASLTAPTFATSITGSYLTASEILITDGDKKIVSAAVATYPSLTELAYVKGVSSDIQTQIGNKAAKGANSDITSITGLTTALTIAQGGIGATSLASASIPTYTSTNTFTNKRITQRVVTTTDDSTAAIDTDVTDLYDLSAVANATTFTLTGTPTDGQKLMIRFKDAGTTKGLTWTGFTAIGVTLPTDTTASKQHYVGCVYNGTTGTPRWEVIAVGVEA